MSKLQKASEHIQYLDKSLLDGIVLIINQAHRKVAVYLNAEASLMYWNIGNFINSHLKENQKTAYGKQIIATLSQQLTEVYGKGYTYSALTRMCKVAETFSAENMATLSQHLSWSHLIELSVIENELKRDFYCQMNIHERWSVRDLREQMDKMLFERTAIAKQPGNVIKQSISNLKEGQPINPEMVFKSTYVLDFLQIPHDYSESELEDALVANIEKFILELGNGFAFIERQKRIPVDTEDYHLDLLFYHRKLKRLVAIDLKLGKFKPQHKAQMELYLKWLKINEMQPGENSPVGLLLCSEGNTEHIELLMLDEPDIRVAQYLTELPSKEWFAAKLHRALEIAKQNASKHE